jgi:hypothetical protein
MKETIREKTIHISILKVSTIFSETKLLRMRNWNRVRRRKRKKLGNYTMLFKKERRRCRKKSKREQNSLNFKFLICHPL